MAIQGIYTFNENDATNVYDYSTNARDATSIANFSVVASDIGYQGRFNGTSTDLNFGDVYDFAGTDVFGIITRLKSTNGTAQVIAHKANHWTLAITALNKVTFKVFHGAANTTLTSIASIADATLTTLGFTYDGADLLIYINGALDTSVNATGNIPASTNDFHLGTDSVDFLNGAIEMFSVYSQDLVLAKQKAVHDKPGGFVINLPDSTNFSNGDLIEVSAKGTTAGAQCVITGDLGSNQVLMLPLVNDNPQYGDLIKRVGNIYDTARQCSMKMELSSADPTMYVYTGVTSFTLPTPAVKIGCDGITNPADPTNPTKVLRGDGSWGYVRLFSQYALKTITNTTTKTTLFGTGEGSPIVPAGYFDELGVMANLIMMGSWSKSTGGALILLIEVTDSGGTTEIHRKSFSNAQLGGGGTTNGHWEIRMLSTCYATGATGQLMTHASLSLLENNSAEILGTHSETSEVTVDFTGTIEIVVTAQWDTKSTNLSIGSANVILKAQ